MCQSTQKAVQRQRLFKKKKKRRNENKRRNVTLFQTKSHIHQLYNLCLYGFGDANESFSALFLLAFGIFESLFYITSSDLLLLGVRSRKCARVKRYTTSCHFVCRPRTNFAGTLFSPSFSVYWVRCIHFSGLMFPG